MCVCVCVRVRVRVCVCVCCTHQVRAHVRLQPDLVGQGHLCRPGAGPLAGPAHHLLVAPPLEPVGQEGLHHLVQDLAGDEQRCQTLQPEGDKEVESEEEVESDPQTNKVAFTDGNGCCSSVVLHRF